MKPGMLGFVVVLVALLPGCLSMATMNDGMSRVDRVWQLEYQKTEDDFRLRVVEANFGTVFLSVRKAFIDLGMPVQERGAPNEIVAESLAPAPLSQVEWKEVVRIEGPRMKQVGGWYLVLPEDPADYIVSIKATLMPLSAGTVVLLDYSLNSPKLQRSGFRGAKYAPPIAVKFATSRFWAALEKRLVEAQLSAPRKRTIKEREA